MTERLYFHVGAPKSGTTYLQAILEGNRAELAHQGVLLVGKRHIDRVHAAMVIREDSRLADLPAAAGQAWERLVAEIRDWEGPSAILSYELFAAASRGRAARALTMLEGIEVHLVVTARDYARALPSAWQERLKFALTEPLETFSPDTSMGARAQWGWRTMEAAGVAERWGSTLSPEHVHIVTMPRHGDDRHEFWRRFAQACALDSTGLMLDQERVNESMGVVEAELLRRVNAELGGRIEGGREQSVWLRDLLAHEVLAGIGSETIGVTTDQRADAAARSDHAIQHIRDFGHAVHGDLDDLRPDGHLSGRLPSEVLDGELLESAVETIVRLLLTMRERAREAAPVAAEPTPEGGRLHRGLAAASAPAVEARRKSLERRIGALEKELSRARSIQQRLGELGDVVSELLLPAADQDGVVLDEAVRRYRRDAL